VLERAESLGYAAVGPVVRAADRAGVTPNAVTLFSVFIAFTAAVLLYLATPVGYAFAAALVVINGVLDVVDGELARRTGEASDGGDLLDHVADRYADTAVVAGAAGGTGEWFLGTFAVSGVLLVADAGTAAQASGVGRLYRGFLTRADISTLVVVGSLATATGLGANGTEPFVFVLGILGVGGHVTTVQRAVTVKRLAGNNS
jgi:archaetidylinositol phosphate synthase